MNGWEGGRGDLYCIPFCTLNFELCFYTTHPKVSKQK